VCRLQVYPNLNNEPPGIPAAKQYGIRFSYLDRDAEFVRKDLWMRQGFQVHYPSIPHDLRYTALKF
jgi:hypothetical protein